MSNSLKHLSANTAKDLLKLMRELPNRRCCDCNVELNDMVNIYGSVVIGCFVCINCKQIHESLQLPLPCKAVYLDNWTSEELETVCCMGNKKTNEIYERYMPAAWSKPTPDADQGEIKKWIKAKYEVKLFMVPILEGTSSFEEKRTLPIRLVDYFAVIGLGQIMPEMKEKLNHSTVPEEVIFRPEVLDCFPEADTHAESAFPEHIGLFAFPDGLKLSRKEKPPGLFSFVLTNVSGVKIYGVCLVIHEELDHNDLHQAIFVPNEKERNVSPSSSPLPKWLHHRRMLSSKSEAVFAPKALVLLGHYPFYSPFEHFLAQLYRISLSESPLPIERYISNFVGEVPLPPQGKVHVVFSLPDRTLKLKRPPYNRLPLVDFSYRPLFTCLSVDNILTVFSFLLTESKVVLFSSHIAILNPVAEALLSLLFPFVWQGAYIPVMPSIMTDMLGAPVPFLVGILSENIANVPPQKRPFDTIYVDLDNDSIDLGFVDNSNWSIEQELEPQMPKAMPERATAKLRTKLTSLTANIHISSLKSGRRSFQKFPLKVSPKTPPKNLPPKIPVPLTPNSSLHGGLKASNFINIGKKDSFKGAKDSSKSGNSERSSLAQDAAEAMLFGLENIDLAFPTNEHMLPISSFATEQGHQAFLQSPSQKEGGLLSKFQNMRSRKSSKNNSHYRHPSLDSSSNPMLNIITTKSVRITDSENNSDPNDPLGFDAEEIRATFLRFFVSILQTYEEHLIPVATQFGSRPNDLFNRESFLKDFPSQFHDFLNAFLRSQMFERFLEEHSSEKPPEIRFFEESIIQKINRKKQQIIKKGTPFLNDTTQEHSQIFAPPQPNNAGLPDDGRIYSYKKFPKLDPALFGKVRWAQRLFKVPERTRIVSSMYQKEMIARGSVIPLRGKKKMPEKSILEDEIKEGDKADNVIQGIVLFQIHWRKYKAKVMERKCMEAAYVLHKALVRHMETRDERMNYIFILMKVKTIQRVWRNKKRRERKALFVKWIIAIQSLWRMKKASRVYFHTRNAIVTMQSLVRYRQCRAAYLIVRGLIIICQALVRGWLKRREARKERAERLKELRMHIFNLWNYAHTPLIHRSKFWVLFSGEGMLDIAIHEDEALSLWRVLGLIDQGKESLTRLNFGQASKAASEWVKLQEISRGNISLAEMSSVSPSSDPPTPPAPRRKTMWAKAIEKAGYPKITKEQSSPRKMIRKEDSRYKGIGLTRSAITALRKKSALGFSSNGLNQPDIKKNSLKLKEEREMLYNELKKESKLSTTSDALKQNIFVRFDLQSQKKRKVTLVNLLWENYEMADASAEAVLSLATSFDKEHSEAQTVWMNARKDARIRADLLCTVQACIVSIQGIKCMERERKHFYQQRAAAVRVLSNQSSSPMSSPAVIRLGLSRSNRRIYPSTSFS